MFDASLVFIIGTAFSFFPLLWLMNRFNTKTNRRVEQAAADEQPDRAQTLFLATLKQEGFERAAGSLESARKDLERRFDAFSASTGHEPYGRPRPAPEIPLLTRERLSESISLVESLFSRSTARRFRETIHALETDYRNRNIHWPIHAKAAVNLLSGELRDIS